jgi:type II secretory pathway pseudopilin PulG
LLVVISILGVLAAVVVLNVVGFMGEGKDEAKTVELKHVHTAAGLYILDGNQIASVTEVGPDNLGIVADYLTGNLVYKWNIYPDGSVTGILFSSALTSLDGFTSLSGGWTAGPSGLSSGGVAGSVVATGGSWDDFTFETSVVLSSGEGYGMYYRSDSDTSDGYILQFDAENGFTVSKVVGGTILALDGVASVMPVGFQVNGQHNISVSVSGSSHTVSVDGSQVMSFTDGTYGSGTVGLQSAAGSNVNFTGFTVSPP